jgi:hypothetical protein
MGRSRPSRTPGKWPNLFDFRAAFIEPPGAGAKPPPVSIVLPDGIIVSSTQRDLNQILSRARVPRSRPRAWTCRLLVSALSLMKSFFVLTGSSAAPGDAAAQRHGHAG